jgi:hypothetical protein
MPEQIGSQDTGRTAFRASWFRTVENSSRIPEHVFKRADSIGRKARPTCSPIEQEKRMGPLTHQTPREAHCDAKFSGLNAKAPAKRFSQG